MSAPHQTSCDLSGLQIAETARRARLAAAAPELLAVLKNLVDRKLIKDTHDDLYDEVNDHYEEVLEAIAKAEGTV